MGLVACMGIGVGLIDALAVHETGEERFIGPVVDRQVAFGALELAGCLLEHVLISCLGMLLLDGQKLPEAHSLL